MAISGFPGKDEEPLLLSQINPPNNLMVEHKDVKSDEFDVQVIKWIDGTSPGYNRILIHPIELGNLIEFRNKGSSNFTGAAIDIPRVVAINKQTQEKKGFLGKKENVVLEILLSQGKGSTQTQNLIVDVEDKHAQTIIDIVDRTKEFNSEEYWKAISLPVSVENNAVVNVNIFPSAPFLGDGEQLLWSSVSTEGIIRSHIIFLNALTNYRILQYDFKSHLANYATMGAIDDVVVTNQRRVSDSAGSGTYTGTRVGQMRTGFGTTRHKSTGVTIGDVVFMSGGKEMLSITQIKDPHGLARLAKSARKQYGLLEKALKKVATTGAKKPESTLACNKCGFENKSGANFCNNCGNTLR